MFFALVVIIKVNIYTSSSNFKSAMKLSKIVSGPYFETTDDLAIVSNWIIFDCDRRYISKYIIENSLKYRRKGACTYQLCEALPLNLRDCKAQGHHSKSSVIMKLIVLKIKDDFGTKNHHSNLQEKHHFACDLSLPYINTNMTKYIA